MAGTGLHPEGHRLRPVTAGDFTALGSMWCRNCLTVDPEPGSECIDDDEAVLAGLLPGNSGLGSRAR